MRVLLAGATRAIGRPLIRGLKQHGHSAFGLVRSSESARMLTEMGAEALIGDAVDAALIRAAITRARPDAVINELTSLPRHYTPAEMKAAAERDSRVRREGHVNLLAGMRESGVRRYVLQSSGFWYAPGPGLADKSSLLSVDDSPGVAAGARTDVELESTAFRESAIDCVAMRYGFFYGPGTWFTNAGDMGDQVRRQQVPVIGAGQDVASFVHIEDAASATVTALECALALTTSLTITLASSAYGCRRSHALAGRRNRFKSPSRTFLRLPAPTASITRRACAAPPTRRPETDSISARVRSSGSKHERSRPNVDERKIALPREEGKLSNGYTITN
jgi:nucleoside-diphosphate-sugar epimerase